jgi:hypothetical protein
MRRMADAIDLFTGRVAVLATMHRKEQAIAPILSDRLGIEVTVPSTFNTDHFGTFTGDIKRPADQLTTARLKATAALDHTGATLAIASEGSFGPHPQLPFVPCDRELILLVDRQHQIEILGECLSTETNYRSDTVRSPEAALAFAETVGFPSHGLVVKAVAQSGTPTQAETIIAKGITTPAALTAAVATALDQSPRGEARIETDMRALYNPTRMGVIAQATEDLVRAIAHGCPACGCPGFSAVQRFPGLPCSLCGSPTLLTLAVLYRCQRCYHEQRLPGNPGTPTADPSQCPYCNP